MSALRMAKLDFPILGQFKTFNVQLRYQLRVIWDFEAFLHHALLQPLSHLLFGFNREFYAFSLADPSVPHVLNDVVARAKKQVCELGRLYA